MPFLRRLLPATLLLATFGCDTEGPGDGGATDGEDASGSGDTDGGSSGGSSSGESGSDGGSSGGGSSGEGGSGSGGSGGGGDTSGTPLVLAFDERPVLFEAATGPSRFDISGGGCFAPDWPGLDTPWLALDRDGDGFVRDGGELFGSGSRLADGTLARDGFAALAELDADHDGAFTPRDPTWARVVLWTDVNGDRLGQPGEQVPLSGAGVEAIDLGVWVDERCDARGNCERERSRFVSSRGGGSVVDVHLVCG